MSILGGEWDDPYKAAEIAAAERQVIEAGLRRYLAAERGVSNREFMETCERFCEACRALLHLREGSKP
jgi:hypothetical protein